MSVDQNVVNLVKYLKTTYDQVHCAQQEEAEYNAKDVKGSVSRELEVGDLVKVKHPPTNRREGPWRFWERCRKPLFRIASKLGQNTFKLADARETNKEYGFHEHADNLVLMDMPELDIRPSPVSYTHLTLPTNREV